MSGGTPKLPVAAWLKFATKAIAAQDKSGVTKAWLRRQPLHTRDPIQFPPKRDTNIERFMPAVLTEPEGSEERITQAIRFGAAIAEREARDMLVQMTMRALGRPLLTPAELSEIHARFDELPRDSRTPRKRARRALRRGRP